MKYAGRLLLVTAALLIVMCSYVPVGMSYSSSVTVTGSITATYTEHTGGEIINNDPNSGSDFTYESSETTDTDGFDTIVDSIEVTPSGSTSATPDIRENFDITFEPRYDYFYVKISIRNSGNSGNHDVSVRIVTTGGTLEPPAVSNKDSGVTTYYICMVNGSIGYKTGDANAPSVNNISQWLTKTTVKSVELVGARDNANAPIVTIDVVYHDFQVTP